MRETNFTEAELAGRSAVFQDAVRGIRARFGFDFVSIGMTSYLGAPLRWVYSDGATSERLRRISLAPGHGIGGIVVKAGKPMLLTDIDKEMDPREYSSYPIVFAEDLRSFCALPLLREGRTVAVLLCAFRSVGDDHKDAFLRMFDELDGELAGLTVVSSDFLHIEGFSEDHDAPEAHVPAGGGSSVIEAQENERRRISRELHDGVCQELLGVSIRLRGLEGRLGEDDAATLRLALANVDRVLEELHDISVTLRPSSLDNLGLLSALRSQALLLESRYGVRIAIEGDLGGARFDAARETQVYRICQEAVLNACRHSGADEVHVRIGLSDGTLHAQVVDHGTGFDVARPLVKGTGCGLAGMRERAGLIGASLTTESGPEGTTVTLIVPLEDEQAKATSSLPPDPQKGTP